ncbi:MAG: S8 family serine peptidase [Anaerolineales bacterium]
MKRFIRILIILAILSSVSVIPALAEGPDLPTEIDVSGEYLLLVKGNKGAQLEREVEKLGGTLEFFHEAGFAFVSGLSEEAAQKLGRQNFVQDIQLNVLIEFDPGIVQTAPLEVADVPESPNDPTTAARFSWQWNMRAIDADDAWAEGYLGSSDVTVAILDTGIDYTYPDLFGRVDLSRSVSFVPEDDVYVNYYFPGKHPVTDIHYHGTHVAATVASNGYVAAGVTSKTTLMGVKVCSAVLGYCPGEAIVQGVLHAVDNGADVINMSLGGGFAKSEYPGYVSVVNKLYNYAKAQDVTIVVSAGNDSMDLDHNGDWYSTYCDTPATICVSATGPTSADDLYVGPWYEIDAPASYTNFGRSGINVAAPGGNSGGYVWAACSQTSVVIPGCQTGVYVIGLGGTSMASPHVAGLAAMLVDQYGNNPGRIKTALQQGAEDLGQPGVDPFYGKGRINVFDTVAP